MRRLPVACALGSCFLIFAACTSDRRVTKTGDRDDDGEIKEHRDQWHPNEAQSDFIDIGKQAGIEWLSFVQQDQQEYPEYFTGLDRDQKRRLRLAPKGSDEQVLLEFKLPEGSKLWPVDWYGTELMAVDLPDMKGFSVALAKPVGLETAVSELALKRWESFDGGRVSGGGMDLYTKLSGFSRIYEASLLGEVEYLYLAREISGKTGQFVAIVEWRSDADALPNLDEPAQRKRCIDVLSSISITRELALEGSPKHKCTSTLDEQLAGTLRFANGTLKLPVAEGQLVRKTGGDSTIQIDGEGAEPWLLLRRMGTPDDDIRAFVRKTSAIDRRRKTPSAKFGAGYTPVGATLPLVVWDYGDSGAENELVGVLKAGGEYFVFEVVSTGLTDGDKRRAAKAAALKLLAGATAVAETTAPEFGKLIGWNASE